MTSIKKTEQQKINEEQKISLRTIPSLSEAKVWIDWEVRFMGNIAMIKGEDESDILDKAQIIIHKLRNTPRAGKLSISMIPKFNQHHLQSVMNEILIRKSNMNYYPIQALNLTGTKINSSMMKILINIMDHKKYQYLTWLNLSQTSLKSKNDSKNDDLCQILSFGLQKNKTLRFLHLSKNPKINAHGLQSILYSISNHQKLRCIWYNSNHMTIEHANVVSDWLASNPNLPRIVFHTDAIDDEMFVRICEGLKFNTKLYQLSIPKNIIHDRGGIALAECLSIPTSNLMRIDISNNYLSIASAHALSKAMSINWTLTDFDISSQAKTSENDGFDDECINILSEGLMGNESLYWLRMNDNDLTSNACFGLGRLLAVHPNLSILEIAHNKRIAGNGYEMLCKGFVTNSRLKRLNFSNTSPGKTGGLIMRKALMEHFEYTTKLIFDCKQALIESSALKMAVNENDIQSLDVNIVQSIVEDFIGYCILRDLFLTNCYPEQLEPGVRDLLLLQTELLQAGHKLAISW